MRRVVSYKIQAKKAGVNISNSNYFIDESKGNFKISSEDKSLGIYSTLPDARRAIIEYVYQNGATGISFFSMI